MSANFELTEACRAIQVAIRKRNWGVLREVPDVPPEDATAFPFVATFPGTGTFATNTPEDIVGLHNIHIELHVARKDMVFDYLTAIEALNGVVMAFYSEFNAGALTPIQTFTQLSYNFGQMRWGDVNTIGFRIIVEDAKIRTLVEA